MNATVLVYRYEYECYSDFKWRLCRLIVRAGVAELVQDGRDNSKQDAKKGGCALITQRERKVKRATRLVKIEIENGHTTMTIEMEMENARQVGWGVSRYSLGGQGERSGKEQNEMRPTRKLQINMRYNMHDPKLSIWPEEESPHSLAERQAEGEAEAEAEAVAEAEAEMAGRGKGSEVLLLWAKAMNLRARNAIVEWE